MNLILGDKNTAMREVNQLDIFSRKTIKSMTKMFFLRNNRFSNMLHCVDTVIFMNGKETDLIITL